MDPSEPSDSAHNLPPCASMIERLMGSPIPMPLARVVKNGSKSRAITSALTPIPESSTETRIWPASSYSRPDQQPPRPAGNAGHRLDSIHQQIQDHLLQLNAVAQHRGQVRRELETSETSFLDAWPSARATVSSMISLI